MIMIAQLVVISTTSARRTMARLWALLTTCKPLQLVAVCHGNAERQMAASSLANITYDPPCVDEDHLTIASERLYDYMMAHNAKKKPQD
jgi:hypothetical protein